jgi:hypothetical protein
MKNVSLCMAACLLLLSSCQKAADAILEKVSSSKNATTEADGFTRYTITRGEHYATGNTYQPIETSELQFEVKFDSTAIYTSATAENQYDINKLYGFSDNNAQHHSYSARFGWSWTNGALRLYGYVYNEEKVSSKELAAIPIGTTVTCSIKVNNNAYLFYVNNALVGELERKATTPKAAGYMLYPYFGGDETAPHTVNIWIKKL